MDFAIKEERKATDEKPAHQKNVSAWILSAMNQQSQTLRHNLSEVTGAISFNLRSVSFQSCKKNPSKRSGKYLIQPTENDEPFIGYCEQTSFGGGWLLFQYRFNGSLDFYRDWVKYRDGLGSVDGEFWLGLEHLHRITRARKHELLVELKDFEGNYKYARYSEFEIGSEGEKYQLKKLET
uniref:Fibrinogen C-terminal domain-containing protein n=1 Tax=Anopheles merus TaxID=30066 RepID=A0A182VN63_ANOME